MEAFKKPKDTVIFKLDPELKLQLKLVATKKRQTMTEFITALLKKNLTPNN